MSATYTGTTEPALQDVVRTWKRTRGYLTTVAYAGPPEAIAGLIAPVIANGATDFRHHEMQGPFHSLEVTYDNQADGSEQPAQDAAVRTVWTLQGNDLQKTIFTHPLIQPLGPAVIDAIITAQSSGDKYEDKVAAVTKAAAAAGWPASGATLEAPSQAMAVGVLNMVLEGTDSREVSQFVLRKRMTIGANSSLRPNMENILNIFNTAGLTAAEAIPPTILFALPVGWWSKRSPTVDEDNSGKFLVTQEYWYAEKVYTWLFPNRVTA